MLKSKKKSSLYIPSLTFSEIEQVIAKVPALILPVGGLEPVGDHCALGAIQESTMAISACVSEKCKILLNPLLAYSNTTCYRNFGGSSGVKANIYESVITQIAKDCAVWGVRYLFIIDGCYGSHDIVRKVIKRIEKNPAMTIRVSSFNWQHDPDIQAYIDRAGKFFGIELGRSEFGILSMISYINPALIRSLKKNSKTENLCKDDIFQRWKKRGQDPEKFRKLFPHCSTSLIENDIDPKFGKELFEYIVINYEKIIAATVKN